MGEVFGAERVVEGRSGRPATVEETQVEEETIFVEEFNERIKIDEFNTAPQSQVMYNPNKEDDCLENQIKEIDDELKRYEINNSNYLGDLGGSQTA